MTPYTAASIGFSGSEQALWKYYNSLKGMRVYCPKCPRTLPADLLHFHLLKKHYLDSPDDHNRIREALKAAVVNWRGLRACLKIHFHRGVKPVGEAGCVSWR